MNERIAILMNQARAQYRNQDLPHEQGLIAYSEKFAELIIKECAGICEKDGKWWAEQGSLMEAGEAGSLAIQIREHFGVEE